MVYSYQFYNPCSTLQFLSNYINYVSQSLDLQRQHALNVWRRKDRDERALQKLRKNNRLAFKVQKMQSCCAAAADKLKGFFMVVPALSVAKPYAPEAPIAPLYGTTSYASVFEPRVISTSSFVFKFVPQQTLPSTSSMQVPSGSVDQPHTVAGAISHTAS
ncbi:hypothetical protein L6452_44088 [Arctium lappa]|uniref:Uncharacterized protein n=1 Tax=Arctium lappa TaxID=4217 RepID=A0ACB8XF84_ARCLA|nr:hypothetical protein L6452_44088 [Arctium lappa]